MRRAAIAWLCLVAVILACVPQLTMPTPFPTPSPAATPSATRQIAPATRTATSLVAAQVTAFEALHVRAKPSHQADVVDYLFVGEEVTLTGTCRDGWAEIEWKSSTAWVNSKFLSENKCSEEQ